MEVTAVVLYKGALVHYTVTKQSDQEYVGRLLKYKGTPENEPPQVIHFQKDGRHCTGDTVEQDLMDDLYNTVQYQMKGIFPNLNGSNPRSPYVRI